MNKSELEAVYVTINDVLKKLSFSYGKPFKEFDINNRLANDKNKGALGNIVEEGIFGYDINSKGEADFHHLGLELKTTAVIRLKNKGFRAKERLTLETLNYRKVVNQSFEQSDLWNKIKKMLIVIYEYIHGINYGDMKILKGFVHEFPEEDYEIVKNDYNRIIKKIRDGKAEELSEGDTLFLGACTAGTGQLLPQPFSSVKAKQRKFSLKNSYITEIIRRNLSTQEIEHLLAVSELKENSLEDIVNAKLKRFLGWSEKQICDYFSITTRSKSKFEMMISKMLMINGRVNNTDEFRKANMKLKTIRVQENGRVIESMSFPAFSFVDLVEQDWEDNEFRHLLESSRFMFAIFKEKNGVYYFERVKFWNIPFHVIENDGYQVFSKLKEVLLNGDIVKYTRKDAFGKVSIYNNFPGISFNKYIHVRPHAQDASDTIALPVADKLTGKKVFTKQCFWLNNTYVKEVINE